MPKSSAELKTDGEDEQAHLGGHVSEIEQTNGFGRVEPNKLLVRHENVASQLVKGLLKSWQRHQPVYNRLASGIFTRYMPICSMVLEYLPTFAP